MKIVSFLIFFTVFLSIYGSVSYYLYLRGSQSIPWSSVSGTFYKYFFIAITLSYPIGRLLERVSLNWFSSSLVWVGSFWLAFFFYLFLAVIFIDIARLLNGSFNFIPQNIMEQYPLFKRVVALTILGMVSILIFLGARNANRPVINRTEITLDKRLESMNELNIVFVSDIHMGTIITNSKLKKMVDMINALNPDIVLLGGDIVDEDLAPVIKYNIGEHIRGIRSKYGTYGVTGNHEYIGGVDAAVRYLQEHGITMLRDRSVLIDNSVVLVGRDDSSSVRMAGVGRKPLQEILPKESKRLPTIVLDHQPNAIKEAKANGIDLILSGHTHDGQLWPLNFVTNALFENSWGHKKFGSTHSYVSCGYSSWGPPVRIGNSPEIAQIKLIFQ